jgi:hypothetical protein
MTKTTRVRGTHAKKKIWPPALDTTQQALIAKLQSSREPWQTSGRFEPERTQAHRSTRRGSGAQLLKSVPHEAHAEWTAP